MGSGFNAFAKVAAEGGRIKALAAPGGADLSRKELDKLVEDAKGRGAAGLVWIVVEPDWIRSPVEKFLSEDEVREVLARTGGKPGDLICIVADRSDRVHVALDGLSLWLVLLTTLLTPLCVLISWNYIKDRVKEFFAFLLLLEFGLRNQSLPPVVR
jgi:aspartyl-tRNA synthetase